MGRLISNFQGGFVIGNQIINNIIIIQEAIQSSMKRKKQGMDIKLDMPNAFDRVNHVQIWFFQNICEMGQRLYQ